MKKLYFYLLFLLFSLTTNAQKFTKIFVNLYTDSLKKGTYNYINVDGLLQDGRYIPLDSTEIKFWASDGKFSGNSLYIDKDFNKEKVQIRISSISQPAIKQEFTMFIKQKPDEQLKTGEQLMEEMKAKRSKTKTKVKEK